jgi:hypothetical protein
MSNPQSAQSTPATAEPQVQQGQSQHAEVVEQDLPKTRYGRPDRRGIAVAIEAPNGIVCQEVGGNTVQIPLTAEERASFLKSTQDAIKLADTRDRTSIVMNTLGILGSAIAIGLAGWGAAKAIKNSAEGN